MRIELKDREYWIKRTKDSINSIRLIRENEKSAALEYYNNRSTLFKFLFSQEDEVFSDFGWFKEKDCKNVLSALESECTGDIFVDSDEFEAITFYKGVRK